MPTSLIICSRSALAIFPHMHSDITLAFCTVKPHSHCAPHGADDASRHCTALIDYVEFNGSIHTESSEAPYGGAV